MTAEEWRPIAGFPDYYVSDQGRVMSTKHSSPRILRQRIERGPYPRVELSRGHRRLCHRRVHRLVAEAFHGPGGERQEVRHLNGDPTDNRAINLQWGSRSENVHDIVRHGRHYWANRTHCPRGHEYTEDNTLRWGHGKARVCATCHRERTRLYQATVRAADPDKRNAYQRAWRARRRAQGAA